MGRSSYEDEGAVGSCLVGQELPSFSLAVYCSRGLPDRAQVTWQCDKRGAGFRPRALRSLPETLLQQLVHNGFDVDDGGVKPLDIVARSAQQERKFGSSQDDGLHAIFSLHAMGNF